MKKYPIPSLLLLAFIITSCAKPEFKVNSFHALTNFQKSNDTLVLEMDLSGGPFQGIVLPAQNGKDGATTFHFNFEVENISDKEEAVFYKIYYQNESYKYPETKDGLVDHKYNEKAAENFYGSWVSDSLEGFRRSVLIAPGEATTIIDSLFIAGNPLNEERYFGGDPQNPNASPEEVFNTIQGIRSNPDWFGAIKKKAIERNKPLETQLREDAVWALQNKKSEGSFNQRWQRNPRVGTYKFMLAAGSEADILALPNAIRDMAQIDAEAGVRINPFYFFKPNSEENQNGIAVSIADEKLKTFAVLRPDAGLFYDGSSFIQPSEKPDSMCNQSDDAFKYAHFMQFVNEEVLDSSLHNVDLKANVKGDFYNRADFATNQEFASRNEPSYVNKPLVPCENAWYDPSANALVVQNPGNSDRPYKKENAGVEGRIGFAYGKFTARIKFPEMLSNDNVWNGITCAYWLKFQSLDEWNTRDICATEGYAIHGLSKDGVPRSPKDSYSEIDIEIVKTSRNWPETSYGNGQPPAYYDPGADNNLIVSCTNWDLACHDPENFGIGVNAFSHGEFTYNLHRWDHLYKALTIKTERPVSKTVGDILLYEIDWSPEEITWRVGSSAAAMDEVGYMNKSVTKIPNNQMVPVMSQEFHYGHWWPMTPNPQGDIPYPDDPITGYVYEIIVQ